MCKYSVGDKFVIEIGEVFTGDFSVKENKLYRVKGYRSLVFDKTGLDNLERLDGDYVNENFGELQNEAYATGRKDGQEEAIEWSKQNETDMYNAGLNDAWELAQKLWLPVRHGGINVDIVTKIFECDYFEIPKIFTPQEALAKIEAYEKEQEEIKVGDVVRFKKNPSCEILITATSRGLNGVHLQTGEFGRKGEVHSDICKDYIEKTGKNIKQLLSAILAEIGKE